MIIRIVFEDIGSKATEETQFSFYGSPSGTCLTSTNAFNISSEEIKDKVGKTIGFWHLDINTLNKHYYGVRHSLNSLASYPGVKSVDVLSIQEEFTSSLTKEQYDTLAKKLLNYLGDTI
jgi:hypothetical protein